MDQSWRRSEFDPEDFSDVFGGPPRSVFWRKMGGGRYSSSSSSSSFYEEVFCPPEIRSSGEYGGRGLPAFRIPGTSERFYSDVFGDDRRSRERSRANSKAKSNSSNSVLSSEEMSPLRPPFSDHFLFSDFASNLRPINVPNRKNSSTTKTTMQFNGNEKLTNSSRKQNVASFNTNRLNSYVETQLMETETNLWNFAKSHSHFGFSRRVSSPETIISLGPDSYPSLKVSVEEDADLNSPSSVVSSMSLHHLETNVDVRAKLSDHIDGSVHDYNEDEDEDDDDDEIMSSYVIEIGSGSDHYREGNCDAVCIDDAIAWAKEKFQTHVASEKELKKAQEQQHDDDDDDTKPNAKNQSSNETLVQSSPKMDIMKHQDENIRLWSVGKEGDIRLLLSTLHYILWDNSGWCAIPVSNLIESTKVKKAYQKARLCLHPDKLQQRGATLPQKYIADKAFSILQDAWATFISQDVSFQ